MKQLMLATVGLALATTRADAGDPPKIVDTWGIWNTNVQVTDEMVKKVAQWKYEFQVMIQTPAESDDVLIFQLQKAGKKLGKPETCKPSHTYHELSRVANPKDGDTPAVPARVVQPNMTLFQCSSKGPFTTDGLHEIELSYRATLADKTYPVGALSFNVLAPKSYEASYETRTRFRADNDWRLAISTIEELHPTSGHTTSRNHSGISDVLTNAYHVNHYPHHAPKTVIRTWFKDTKAKPMPARMNLSCMHENKAFEQGEDENTTDRERLTYTIKPKTDDFVETRWVERVFVLDKASFDPELPNVKSGDDERWYFSKHPGNYKCVVMGDGKILKELSFEIGKTGEIEQHACQKSFTTVRGVSLLTVKDKQIATTTFDAKAGRYAFFRDLNWGGSCPPRKK